MSGKSRSLGSLLVNVGADTRALESGLKQATSSVKEFGNKTGQVTRRSSRELERTGRAGAGMGAGIAAGFARAAAVVVAPVGAALAVAGAYQFATGAFSDSMPNQMRKMKLEQRKMKLMMSPNNKIASGLNYWTNFENIKAHSQVAIGERLVQLEGRANKAIGTTPFASNIGSAMPFTVEAIQALIRGSIPGGNGPAMEVIGTGMQNPGSVYNFVTGVGEAFSNWWGVNP